jgi:hypothetical protein
MAKCIHCIPVYVLLQSEIGCFSLEQEEEGDLMEGRRVKPKDGMTIRATGKFSYQEVSKGTYFLQQAIL